MTDKTNTPVINPSEQLLIAHQQDNLSDALGILCFMQQTLCNGEAITLDSTSQEGLRCLLQQTNSLIQDTLDMGI